METLKRAVVSRGSGREEGRIGGAWRIIRAVKLLCMTPLMMDTCHAFVKTHRTDSKKNEL